MRAAIAALALMLSAAAYSAERKPVRILQLPNSGVPATLEDCRRAGFRDADAVINHDPQYSDRPRSLLRFCVASRRPAARPPVGKGDLLKPRDLPR